MLAGQANCQYGDDERDYNHDRADQGGPPGQSRVLAHPISKAHRTTLGAVPQQAHVARLPLQPIPRTRRTVRHPRARSPNDAPRPARAQQACMSMGAEKGACGDPTLGVRRKSPTMHQVADGLSFPGSGGGSVSCAEWMGRRAPRVVGLPSRRDAAPRWISTESGELLEQVS
jgi:hypothetical protein